MSGLLSNVLPMAGAAAGGYAQGHVQRQQMDQQKQQMGIQQMMAALQQAEHQRKTGPASAAFRTSLQGPLGSDFNPHPGVNPDELQFIAQLAAQNRVAESNAALQRQKDQLGLAEEQEDDERHAEKTKQWESEQEIRRGELEVKQNRLRLDTIRAKKVTDPDVLFFMGKNPAYKKLVEDAYQQGTLDMFLQELARKGKFIPGETGGIGEDDEPPMPKVKPATRRPE